MGAFHGHSAGRWLPTHNHTQASFHLGPVTAQLMVGEVKGPQRTGRAFLQKSRSPTPKPCPLSRAGNQFGFGAIRLKIHQPCELGSRFPPSLGDSIRKSG